MTTPATYRVRILLDENALLKFSWQIFAPGKDTPLIESRHRFRSDKAAVRDACAILERRGLRGVVER